MVSWMSMNRIDHNPGRGTGSSCRAKKNAVSVTAEAASHISTPAARIQGVDPDSITTRPAIPTASAQYPRGGPRQPSASVRCAATAAAPPWQ